MLVSPMEDSLGEDRFKRKASKSAFGEMLLVLEGQIGAASWL